MTDNVTNQLLLEHLKAIQGRLSNIEEETRIMRTEIAGMSQNIAAHSLRLDRFERVVIGPNPTKVRNPPQDSEFPPLL